jgi:hypothetical protein
MSSAAAAVSGPERDQPLGLGIGQRTEQHRVTTLKIAVLAPMPSARVRTATRANAGLRARLRTA